jgi:hypothetical protein
MGLPNRIHCRRCGQTIETEDWQSIADLTSDIKEITAIEGITIHFSFCQQCRMPLDADFPETTVSQMTEHAIQ